MDINIRGEIHHIVGRARAREARIVTLGVLLLFSTQDGDAWMLDHQDGLAVRLADDGVSLDVEVMESDEAFCIGWTHELQATTGALVFVNGEDAWELAGPAAKEVRRAIHAARSRRPPRR